MTTKKGKIHYSSKKKQKGRWMYPSGNKAKRYWKKS